MPRRTVETTGKDGRRTGDGLFAGDGSAHLVEIAGETLALDPSGVLFWPRESVLVVSDLHLEKGSSHAERGIFLPPYDTAATLAALAVSLARYDPETVLCLGDSFHDRRADRRISASDREAIFRLQAGRSWYWISGNHDPEAPVGLAGESCTELAYGRLVFRHEPVPEPSPGEIAGHLHPSGRVRTSGRSVRRRCFAGDGSRLVVPAFGAFTGGLNVLDPAWAGIFSGRRFNAYLLGDARVFTIPGRSLIRDRTFGGVRLTTARTQAEARRPKRSISP